MLFESGHRSMVAWNFIFSICFLSISLSIWARMARSRFEAEMGAAAPALYQDKKSISNPTTSWWWWWGGRERAEDTPWRVNGTWLCCVFGPLTNPVRCGKEGREEAAAARERTLEPRKEKWQDGPEIGLIFIYSCRYPLSLSLCLL